MNPENNNLNDYLYELIERAWREEEEPSKDEKRKAYLEGVQDALAHIQEWIEEHRASLEAPNGNMVTFVEVD
jgi:hypothetical protein